MPRHSLTPPGWPALLLLLTPVAARAQMLETETARLLPAHGFEISTNFEYQTSADGHETAVPVAFEYGLTNRWEILVEPVPYTAIRPKSVRGASGVGDLEATLTYRLRSESPGGPALALAGEVKVPAAESRLIGTDQTDYTGYLIASRRFGAFDLHANLGYTIPGRPPGVRLSNLLDYAVGGILDIGANTRVFGEILGNTTAIAGGGESSVAQEIAGGEVSGTVGIGRSVARNLLVYLGGTMDNSGAFLLHPGVTLRLH